MKVKQMIDERPLRMSYNQVEQLGYKDRGELLDQTPLALPFDCKKPETLEAAIDRILSIRDSRQLDNEWESEEESEDFDCDDDEVYDTPYTLFDDVPEGGSSLKASAASADDSAPAPEPTPKKQRKAAKVSAEPEPTAEDDE